MCMSDNMGSIPRTHARNSIVTHRSVMPVYHHREWEVKMEGGVPPESPWASPSRVGSIAGTTRDPASTR